MKIAALIFLSAITISSSAQKLTPEEKKIVDNVRIQMPQTLQLLEQIVNVNSGTLNVAGVKKVGSMLTKQFDDIGFTTTWVTLPDSLKRAGHLVATKKGARGKKLLLIGHLDTVFEPDMPPNPFQKLNDSTATGQGVNDMKGGDLVILAALQALHKAGLLNNVTITAYFTGDEEKTGVPINVSRADFIARAKQSDIALAFETSQGLNTVATARRGSSSWKLNVYGMQAHSGGIFNNNYGAIYEASRIVNAFRDQLSNEQYLTFNPGIFIGGSEVIYDSANLRAQVSGKTNIISPSAIVQGDLRFLTDKQKLTARANMKTIASTNNLAATRAEIFFEDNIPSMEPTAGNNNLLAAVNRVSSDLNMGGTKAGDPGSRGAGDISYIAKYVDCLDGLGVGGRGAHAPGETINLNDFPKLIQRAALLIYRLTR